MLTAGTLVAPPASARPPSPAVRKQRAHERAVLARIDAIGASLERVVQEYDGARLQLAAVERRVRLNEIALGVARRNLRVSRQRLAARIVSLYVNGEPGTLEVLAGAKSISDLIDRLESARVLSRQDAALGEAALRFTWTVRRREALLRRLRRERTATVARLASRRRTIEAALARQRRLLASIHRTIREIQAREAARQRRLAELARERIAREVAAQRAASPPAPEQAAPEQQAAPAPAPGLVPSPAPVPIAPSSSAGHPQAAELATRYLGVPYVWGGASPSGFDCSGLVSYVYAQLGISLPHYTVSQWNATIPISTSQLEPGDLVFFDGLGHVGIYIGSGQFIHAPHTGAVVQIASLSGYWESALVGARRVP